MIVINKVIIKNVSASRNEIQSNRIISKAAMIPSPRLVRYTKKKIGKIGIMSIDEKEELCVSVDPQECKKQCCEKKERNEKMPVRTENLTYK